MTPIKEQFRALALKAFGGTLDGVPPVQLQEMERMFFAGYSACFFDTVANPEKEHASDREIARDIMQVERELREYFRLLGQVPRYLEKN